MGDIKLFRTGKASVEELEGRSVEIEKSLQTLLERHLETFLGVRFLGSEYSTGATHGGRIDTLGIDENGFPVIIEYKRALNENVINQGLFYLDWLMDHKAEFKLLVMEKCGREAADEIDWTSPRLLCVAGDFTKYDEHAVNQIPRNIELIRYRRYGDELLLMELVNAAAGQEPKAVAAGSGTDKKRSKGVAEYLETAPSHLRDLYESLYAFMTALGDDIQVTPRHLYIAFRRIKNFACVEVHPQASKLLVFLKVDPDRTELQDGFTRDVRNIGHFGTGDLEITLKTLEDLERAKPLILRSYEAS